MVTKKEYDDLLARVAAIEQTQFLQGTKAPPKVGPFYDPELGPQHDLGSDKPMHACLMERKCCKCGKPIGASQKKLVERLEDGTREPHLVHLNSNECTKET